MSSTNKQLLVLLCAAVAGAAIFYAASFLPVFESMRHERALSGCKTVNEGDNQIECIFRVLSSEMKNHGLSSAMEAFSRSYELFPEFVSGGCHHQAHRVGDLAYYNLYLGTEDLEKIDFTQSTTACGYGFYHGFMEHLIQDRPTPEFVDEVCMHLTGRLGSTMGDIQLTCYHGAGHGFILAQIERLKVADWGNLRAFTDEPLAWCRQLKQANDSDIEQCLEGVFNVVVDSMADNRYGFSYNYERPFEVCDALPQDSHRACYYEMAQKLDKASNLDPVVLADIAMAAQDAEYRELAFKVGIAGVVQQVIVDSDGSQILEQCRVLSDELYEACLGSIVNGLYEHGDPQEEYKKALGVCTHASVVVHGAEQHCYETVANRLPRFYDDAKITRICREFPAAYMATCEAQIGSRADQ